MSAANCPSCGGQVEFAVGSSAAVVCNYCRTIVARTDRGVEDYGKVAAIIDTQSPLRSGLTGKHRGTGFRLTGRTQLRHQAGGVWDEWYAAFDDGRWGWLAEAQGRYFLTFRTEDASDVPPYERLELGASFDNFQVTELGVAELASAEGELPWRPHAGDKYEYADLSGPEGRFATIDYSEEKPLVFKGTETTLEQLGIKGEAVKARRIAVEKLSCSNCGAPLELKAPDQAERIYCPSCGAGHDITEGKLQFFTTLKAKKVKPVLPVGSKGTVGDTEYVVAGFLQRSVTFDKKYFWMEYLLFNREKGFRWLVHSDEHWSFVQPIPAGDVVQPHGAAGSVEWQNKDFKLFQDAEATVEHVIGEFYWRVAIGEKVASVDYIHPPEGLSKETTAEGAREISWSHQRYMTPEEVEKAFEVTTSRPWGVGPLQPYPGSKVVGMWVMFLIVLIAMAIVVGASRTMRVVFNDAVQQGPVDSAARPNATAFTQPFNLSGNQNVEVRANANMENSWVYVSGDLLNEETGALESFELPIEYYSGIDGGESWSEGSRSRKVHISAPPKGRYVMRLDVQWEKPGTAQVHVEVREGVFRISHLVLAIVAVSIPAILSMVKAWSFDMNRWKDSDYSPYGG